MLVLSPLAFWLGVAGLLPFLAGPLWMTLSPESVPVWLDGVWHQYAGLIAAFMAGSFWGFAMPMSGGTAGMVALLISVALMLLTFVAMVLPLHPSLLVLALVFLLLLLADYWRERTLDSIEGYFRLRLVLTAGVLIIIGWRLLLA
ncbi:MAG: DUF3429 domain-containing protein [Pseudomonadota bacterium]